MTEGFCKEDKELSRRHREAQYLDSDSIESLMQGLNSLSTWLSIAIFKHILYWLRNTRSLRLSHPVLDDVPFLLPLLHTPSRIGRACIRC